jgi:hypothetical protein
MLGTISAIADRCLARSRAHRYQTAQDAGETLRGFLKRYMPGYSRSHLGRYVRKMFASEIERELRMLEEYVLSEEVSDDVGENLIEDVLGPGAEFVGFSPRPSGDTATRVPTGKTEIEKGKRSATPSGSGLDASENIAAGTPPVDIDTNIETGVQQFQEKSRQPTSRFETSRDDGSERTLDGLNVHDAKTLILDGERPASKKAEDDEIPARLPPNYDPALHNAPTLILDTRRRRRKEG